ncbi:MAG: sialidase family protein [Actinomycetota bacterium]
MATGAGDGALWAATSSQVFVTTGGVTWSATPLPSPFAKSAGVGLSQSGQLQLVAGSTSAMDYSQAAPSGGWSTTPKGLSWPAGAPAGPASAVTFGLGSSAMGTVSAVVTEGGAQTGPVSLVLVSADGGRTFPQRDPPTLFGDWDAGFTSGLDGVVVGNAGNAASETVFFTGDGGGSWQASQVADYQPSAAGQPALSPPVVDGSRIFLAANVPGGGGGRQLRVYASDNGGATFSLLMAKTSGRPATPHHR